MRYNNLWSFLTKIPNNCFINRRSIAVVEHSSYNLETLEIRNCKYCRIVKEGATGNCLNIKNMKTLLSQVALLIL